MMLENETIALSRRSEYCNWPESISINVSQELEQNVLSARRTLWANKHIQKIYLEVPSSFISEQTFANLHHACRFEHFISVYDMEVEYFIQSYWSAMIFACYDLTFLLPHPMAVNAGS